MHAQKKYIQNCATELCNSVFYDIIETCHDEIFRGNGNKLFRSPHLIYITSELRKGLIFYLFWQIYENKITRHKAIAAQHKNNADAIMIFNCRFSVTGCAVAGERDFLLCWGREKYVYYLFQQTLFEFASWSSCGWSPIAFHCICSKVLCLSSCNIIATLRYH